MGYLPIFLYFASFVFLFLLVVNNGIKNKKLRFRKSLESLSDEARQRGRNGGPGKLPEEISSLADAEQYYRKIKSDLGQSEKGNLDHLTAVKSLLMRLRQQRYWYNNMVKTKPYSFVARIFGHHPI